MSKRDGSGAETNLGNVDIGHAILFRRRPQAGQSPASTAMNEEDDATSGTETQRHDFRKRTEMVEIRSPRARRGKFTVHAMYKLGGKHPGWLARSARDKGAQSCPFRI